jgi:MoaA/NifB/PqqE/SkfB family radical SAM enzyme
MSNAIELVYFNLFDDCNARCNMCECWRVEFSRRDVSFYMRRLDQVLEMRPEAVRFTGGEPLLLHGLPALVARAANCGTRVSVISNGRLLSAKASALAAAGCVEIVVSLDAVGEVHDQIRGTRGLFAHCLRGIAAVSETSMTYGVNTVVQRSGADGLLDLADVLLAQPSLPRWWHLIPVRDKGELLPTTEQRTRIRQVVQELRNLMATRNVVLLADDAMFASPGTVACNVPTFTAYVRADTGEVFGCNMLAYADGIIGRIDAEAVDRVWGGSPAVALRRRCADGANPACLRCDAGSRAANQLLRKLAASHTHANAR